MADRDSPSETPETHASARWGLLGVLALLVFVWLSNSPGLVSSNDGSHLALARALALNHQTSIGAERALTLEVDLAIRDDLPYSDRPPGTAFAALPAAWIGARIDPSMYERALSQAKAGRPVSPLPGPKPYLLTYAKRAGPGSPALVKLIGTSIVIACHAALVGLLGCWLVHTLLRRLGFEHDARLFALVSLGLASAWGPYATVLFSHLSAATAVAGFLVGIVTLAEQEEHSGLWVGLLTGLAGAWAIACDYLLITLVVPAASMAVHPRRYLQVLLGTLPVVLATFAYHHAAFGSVLSIGYDHQTNFGFARERSSTFSTNPLRGLWILLGAGRGAGLLVQSPLILLGVATLPSFARRALGEGDELRRAWRRSMLACLPWLLLLAAHRTPWGGGSNDYRYLIPALPFAAVGLAQLWRSLRQRWARALLVLLASASSFLTWRHFLAGHEGELFARPALGLTGAAVVVLLGALVQKLRR